MMLAGYEVRLVTHDCFENRHRAHCSKQTWWKGEHDRIGRWVPCECGCHSDRRWR